MIWDKWQEKKIGKTLIEWHFTKYPFRGEWPHWELGIKLRNMPPIADYKRDYIFTLELLFIWFRFYISRVKQ